VVSMRVFKDGSTQRTQQARTTVAMRRSCVQSQQMRDRAVVWQAVGITVCVTGRHIATVMQCAVGRRQGGQAGQAAGQAGRMVVRGMRSNVGRTVEG